MYSTVSFPNIDRSRINFESLGGVPCGLQHLDIDALLLFDRSTGKIGLIDLRHLEGIKSEDDARNFLPPASFKRTKVQFDGILEDFYGAVRNDASYISTSHIHLSDCHTSNFTKKTKTKKGDVGICATAMCRLNATYSVQLLFSLEMDGNLTCNIASRCDSNGVELRKLHCEQAPKDQSSQFVFGCLLTCASQWVQREDKRVCSPKIANPDAEKTLKSDLVYESVLMFTQHDSVIICSIIVGTKDVPELSNEDFLFKNDSIFVRCSKKHRFRLDAPISCLKSLPLSALGDRCLTEYTFYAGLENGRIIRISNVGNQQEFHKTCVYDCIPAPQTVTDPLRKSIFINRIIDILFLSTGSELNQKSLMCVVFSSYVIWFFDYEIQQSPKVIRQDIFYQSCGHHFKESIKQAVLSDFGMSVTLLSTARVMKLVPPQPQCSMPTGPPKDASHDCKSVYVFNAIPYEPITILWNDFADELHRGIIPRYRFVELADRKFSESRGMTRPVEKIETVSTSLRHCMDDALTLASAVHKYTSSKFPTLIFSSPSASQVFYLHFASRSLKFEQASDGTDRIKLSSIGMLSLDIPYCVVENCARGSSQLEPE